MLQDNSENKQQPSNASENELIAIDCSLGRLGAFEILRRDYESKAQEHARRLLEEKFPWMKGNRDFFNGVMALAKASGYLKIEELLEFEKEFAGAP